MEVTELSMNKKTRLGLLGTPCKNWSVALQKMKLSQIFSVSTEFEAASSTHYGDIINARPRGWMDGGRGFESRRS